MSLLINQFYEAGKEWVKRTGLSDGHIAWYVLAYTGGFELNEDFKKRQSQITLEDAKDWLEMLVYKLYMMDIFLIPALIRAQEEQFEKESEGYGGGVAKIRQGSALIEEQAEEIAPKLGKTPEELIQIAKEMAERFGTASLEEMKKRRLSHAVWREITAPILEDENISRALQYWAERRKESNKTER